MVTRTYFRRRHSISYVLALAAFVITGCQESAQIRSYPVPKERKQELAKAAPTAAPGEPTDRMLAAILPSAGQAWFFKVVGPIAAVDQHEKELDDFFTAIRVGDDGKPNWQLPAGWKETPGGNAMRLATIVVPADKKPLEITVNALPWSGTSEDLLANVNRWRGQLQLPAIAAPQVTEFTRDAKAGEQQMTIVDLRGRYAGSGMPPFASAGAASGAAPELPPGHPPIEPSGAPNTEAEAAKAAAAEATSENGGVTKPIDRMLAAILPAGDRAWFFKVVGPLADVDKQADAINKFFETIRAPGGDRPTWTLPADWKEEPGTGMRAATIRIPADKRALELSVIALPWRGTPADLLSNINRWRGQMKLAAADEKELKEFTREIKSGDSTMTVVDLRGRFDAGTMAPFAGARDGNK
jgi:hypothetical protein